MRKFLGTSILCALPLFAHAGADPYDIRGPRLVRQSSSPQEEALNDKIEHTLQSIVKSYQPNLAFRNHYSIMFSIFFPKGFRAQAAYFLSLPKDDPRLSLTGYATQYLADTYDNYIDRVLPLDDESDRELFRESFAKKDSRFPAGPLGFYIANLISAASENQNSSVADRQRLMVKQVLRGLAGSYENFDDEILAKQTYILYIALKAKGQSAFDYLKHPDLRSEIESLVGKTLRLRLPEGVTRTNYFEFLRRVYPDDVIFKFEEAPQNVECESRLKRIIKRLISRD